MYWGLMRLVCGRTERDSYLTQGGFPGVQQTNWAQMQQAAAMQQQLAVQQAAQQAQQQQAQQQQQPKQGRLPPGLPPRPPQSQVAAAAAAAVNGWGSAVNGNAAANGSNANGQTQAGVNGNGACSRGPTPVPVPGGDGQPPSAAGADSAAAGTEDGDDEYRAPSQKERRQQALHKFKQKRKVCHGYSRLVSIVQLCTTLHGGVCGCDCRHRSLPLSVQGGVWQVFGKSSKLTPALSMPCRTCASPRRSATSPASSWPTRGPASAVSSSRSTPPPLRSAL